MQRYYFYEICTGEFIALTSPLVLPTWGVWKRVEELETFNQAPSQAHNQQMSQVCPKFITTKITDGSKSSQVIDH